ncbi:tRNA lysidine(34) synthetase TilS [Sneathiella sp. P13V-1]|uniref:tRNA lysidine(34) synthetase TilS n=1 Tax=Sneathiella sp. P13V-1 TaxID=2697366 RepID=UPI00187B4CE4|nr:tRNA lysidine(34) synthetase TilS [Sneathiella sp. P13V-1]MBE7637965.1 tRNA lysidine(34) synthetase TilS [Sneathiella sp. P13V-1]
MTDTLLEKFERGMEECASRLNSNRRIAIAISGGSDSVGLCYLLKTWCEKHGYVLNAFTVDHGLRVEATDEAKLVARWCKEIGISHQILRKETTPPLHGVQAYARDLRYGLLEEACLADGISDLFLGHQEEDQIETFLMRFSKGSGLSGLAAMRPVSIRGQLTLHRPMLSIPRREIRDYLLERSIDWIEDPSNEDPQYTRTALGKIRAEISNLPGSGQSSLSRSIVRLMRAENAVQEQVNGFLKQSVCLSPLGFCEIDKVSFLKGSTEVLIRVMEKGLCAVSGLSNIERLSEVERLVDGLLINENGATLAGCQILNQKDKLIICREAGRKGLPSTPFPENGEVIWDNRFHVKMISNKNDAAGLLVEAIGLEGFKEIGEVIPKEIKNFPAVIKYNLPVLRKEGEIVAAPLICPEIKGSGIAKGQVEMLFNSEIVLN